MNWEQVRRHYQRPEVKREISEYCKGRWVAVHCEEKTSKDLQLMIRYWRHGSNPLTISCEDDLDKIMERFSRLRPRSFYATPHIYSRISSIQDIMDRENIVASSPTWDIDSKDGDWRKVIEKAVEIIGVLERNGVVKSVFFRWSGRGAHIQVNANAFSDEIRRRIDPLDIAYSITEYVINRLKPEDGVKVENKIDIQRVFTAPLSLHRIVDRVAVCLKPDKIEDFHPEWANPESYKHDPSSWRRFEVGEGDELAGKAYASIGPYIVGRRRRRKHKPLDQEILETFRKLRLEEGS